MAPDFTLKVLLFSVLRQRVGTPWIVVEAQESMTGTELLDHLSERFPEAIGSYRAVIRLAVNEEYVSESIVFSASDEVALITPVSGG